MINVAVGGAHGRMGGQVVSLVTQQPDMKLVGAIESPNSPKLRLDIGEVIGVGKIGVPISSAEKIHDILVNSNADVYVDFTTAAAATKNAKAAAEARTDLVIGTTGFSPEQLKEIEEAIKKNQISAVISPNMAVGVNVFFKIVEEAAKILRDYDIEIIEVHHKYKTDAPSGTAKKVGEIITKALGYDLNKVSTYGRKGITGERKPEEIGFHAIRAGDIVGDHTVLFAGPGERIEIIHRAHSRLAFAHGTMKAIRFVYGQAEPGKIYSSREVLNL
ncbi:MAG: 4-hydroxy-tetrahydrodipicolinate reductase [Euryarchaeota archaeon]|nr:4-hydroxy-tetrahydrodipicolinate reductase [Euryarchaeota archaeon]